MSCDDLGNDLASRTPNGYCLHPPCNSSFDCSGPPPHRNCLERPRCLHLLGTDHIRITNLTMRNAPFWVSAAAPLASSAEAQSAAAQNLHFQFSSDIIVDGVQIYQYPDAANADGIDIDSSRDVIVRNTMVDSNDDHLCVKSGANWLGKRDTSPLRLLPPRSSLTPSA